VLDEEFGVFIRVTILAWVRRFIDFGAAAVGVDEVAVGLDVGDELEVF